MQVGMTLQRCSGVDGADGRWFTSGSASRSTCMKPGCGLGEGNSCSETWARTRISSPVDEGVSDAEAAGGAIGGPVPIHSSVCKAHHDVHRPLK